MRIGLLIYGEMETLSGGYLYNRKLVSYLRSQGEQVEIISLLPRSYWRHFGDNFSQTCLQLIAAANIDILVEDAMVHPSVVLLNRRISRQINIPVITLVHLLTSIDHHPCYSAWLFRAIERRYLQSVSGIIANSQTTLMQIRELLNDRLPPYCLAVPAGDNFSDVNIDIDAISQRALRPGPLQILVVGNVIRRKGLHVLIQALRQLPTEDFQVTVAGRLDMELDYVKQIQALIESSHLQERVILKGPVQGQALAELYRQHQLMVLPSAYESYGIVYVEAQQFGLPVIGTTAGAAKEIINHGDNGYLIPPEDQYALAELLQTLHRDRRLLLQLSRNALAAFAHQPSWTQSCEIIRQYLYARLH
ncbi:MAG: glycosyltransferase family 4 protein [Methylococcaceae bacterium]|nr:glycosyltransferase family 4 protein [Methylococcaceae bacterium]MDZ4156172.1 glycosyltransferase family 4 protein [Methylococcales bacterium]MDP2393750.1 glycosyltransferase family 4 protein [Methylococcaceae bacterium]MDP3019776.1 glycosyltransferase family 4 protein [Methylococcaceae bacterium]MDP3389619.1 glycosyltransferase family 4 protein [Methylococcaceae bacterium]